MITILKLVFDMQIYQNKVYETFDFPISEVYRITDTHVDPCQVKMMQGVYIYIQSPVVCILCTGVGRRGGGFTITTPSTALNCKVSYSHKSLSFFKWCS